MNYLLDTNIVTAVIRDDQRVKQKLQEMDLHGRDVFINAISYYEIKRGLLARDTRANQEKLRIFDEFCREHETMFLDNQEIFDRASEIYAKLRQSGQTVGDADILIAAIAVTRNLVLVSHDSHFDNMDDVTIEDWLET